MSVCLPSQYHEDRILLKPAEHTVSSSAPFEGTRVNYSYQRMTRNLGMGCDVALKVAVFSPWRHHPKTALEDDDTEQLLDVGVA